MPGVIDNSLVSAFGLARKLRHSFLKAFMIQISVQEHAKTILAEQTRYVFRISHRIIECR